MARKGIHLNNCQHKVLKKGFNRILLVGYLEVVWKPPSEIFFLKFCFTDSLLRLGKEVNN